MDRLATLTDLVGLCLVKLAAPVHVQWRINRGTYVFAYIETILTF